MDWSVLEWETVRPWGNISRVDRANLRPTQMQPYSENYDSHQIIRIFFTLYWEFPSKVSNNEEVWVQNLTKVTRHKQRSLLVRRCQSLFAKPEPRAKTCCVCKLSTPVLSCYNLSMREVTRCEIVALFISIIFTLIANDLMVIFYCPFLDHVKDPASQMLSVEGRILRILTGNIIRASTRVCSNNLDNL